MTSASAPDPVLTAVLADLRARLTPPLVIDLEILGDAILNGAVHLGDLPEALAYLCTADGIAAGQPLQFEKALADDAFLRQRLDEEHADADRYYRAAFGRRPKVPTQTRAELEGIRGNPQRAERVEADLRRRFEDVA